MDLRSELGEVEVGLGLGLGLDQGGDGGDEKVEIVAMDDVIRNLMSCLCVSGISFLQIMMT